MRWRLRWLVSASVALVGCAAGSTSGPVTSATPKVVGTLLGPDGAPAVGVTVGVSDEAGGPGSVTGILSIGLSGGLVCLSGAARSICQPSSTTVRATTDSRGRFGLALRPSSVERVLGVEAAPGPGQSRGAEIAAVFTVGRSDVHFPPLRFWDPTPFGAGDPVGLHFDVAPTYALSWLDRGGEAVWAANSPRTLDARILEDVDGTFLAEATGSLTIKGRHVRVTFSNAPSPYRGPDGAPISRGQACAFDREEVAAQPCPLTNGVLHAQSPCRSNGRCPSAAVVVDLGTVRSIGLVVVRGCGGCGIATSTDERDWSTLGTVAGPNAAFRAAIEARYVRAQGAVGTLSQISAWPAQN
jgi:hypothetical protein